jgi:hypothetical protein
MDDEQGNMMGELAAEARLRDRLGALTEYAALRARWLAGEPRPGDHQRRRAVAAILNATGGIPHELHWPKRR